VGNTELMNVNGLGKLGDKDEPERQKETQFVRRRKSALSNSVLSKRKTLARAGVVRDSAL